MSSFYDPSTANYFDPISEERIAIVTGGNSGIGWFTVLHLYLHGYRVYIAGRNKSKVDKAVDDIKTEADARFAKYSEDQKKSQHLGEIKTLHLDCCDLQSVVQCAEEFQAQEEKLDILINNAGVMAVPHEITGDGYEIQYQVNAVAPFLLTMKLLSSLESAKRDSVPRVVNLSSVGHNLSRKYYNPSNTINCKPNLFYSWMRYANAKRAAIEITSKFAQEHKDILAISVHPGIITGTELYNYWTSLPFIGPVAKVFKNITGSVAGVSCEQGALATLRAAMDPTLTLADSGDYFVTGGMKSQPSAVAREQKNIDTTWDANVASLRERKFL